MYLFVYRCPDCANNIIIMPLGKLPTNFDIASLSSYIIIIITRLFTWVACSMWAVHRDERPQGGTGDEELFMMIFVVLRRANRKLYYTQTFKSRVTPWRSTHYHFEHIGGVVTYIYIPTKHIKKENNSLGFVCIICLFRVS